MGYHRLALILAATAIVWACAPSTDTEEMVRGALEQANIREVDVDLDDGRQTVRLSGTVDTLADRVRAEELAAAIIGTSGRIRNEIAVTGLGPIEPTGPETADRDSHGPSR